MLGDLEPDPAHAARDDVDALIAQRRRFVPSLTAHQAAALEALHPARRAAIGDAGVGVRRAQLDRQRSRELVALAVASAGGTTRSTTRVVTFVTSRGSTRPGPRIVARPGLTPPSPAICAVPLVRNTSVTG